LVRLWRLTLSLHEKSAHELSADLRNKEVSSLELTDTFLSRIEGLDPKIQAFVTVTPDEARKAAADTDNRRARGEELHALAGIPIAIKDNMCTQGVRTTCSSRILENFVPPYDATTVSALKRTGAVILGKTNLDEFAMGSSTENSGFDPTRNPWDVTRVPGGSSGGSAAAVAAGLAVWATGSDTGGSIRQPASFCGVTGFKPTYGRVSRYGLVAFASSLDQIGPLTQDARDAALMLQVLAGPDRMDATSADVPVPNYLEEIKKDICGLRLGLPKEYFIEGLDREVEDAVRGAAETLAGLGAEVVEVALPHTEYAIATYYILCMAEASSNLARYDGVVYGNRVPGENLVDMYMNTRSAGFGDEVKRRIMLGTYVLSAGFYDAYYLKGQKVRTLIRQDFTRAFEDCDVILAPVSPTPSFEFGAKSDPLEMYLSDVFTVPASLAGLPAISIPCGLSDGKLPIGLQITGRVFDEPTVLRTAHAYQQATDYHRKRPSLEGPK
jgi:aspartyl-tRNA(Asn)/glutamyl-tRNA(Gln) amidotransferase subunit A